MLLRRMLIMLGTVLVAVILLAAYKGYSIYQQVQMFTAPKPAISVSANPAESVSWQQIIPAIGTLKAVQGIELTSEVLGTVSQVLFESGQQVNAGQTLLQLDDQAERAALATAQAELDLASVEHQRARSLISRQSISKSEYDRLSANLQKSRASVAQLQALLGKKRIQAPFAGTIGIRQVDTGDYLSPGSPIATLQDLSSLHLDFSLPEQQAPQVKVGQTIRLNVAAYPGESFIGHISAINPKVDNQTRNLQVRATLDNPDQRLLPGMFANLEVLLSNESEVVVVPETAITYTLYGNSLYVINEKTDEQGQPRLEVERRYVSTGERRGAKVVISKGLQPGEQVVTSGQLKLENGSHVSIADDPAQPENAR